MKNLEEHLKRDDIKTYTVDSKMALIRAMVEKNRSDPDIMDMMICIEEISELINSLMMNEINRANIINIAEEIVDVRILFQVMRLSFGEKMIFRKKRKLDVHDCTPTGIHRFIINLILELTTLQQKISKYYRIYTKGDKFLSNGTSLDVFVNYEILRRIDSLDRRLDIIHVYFNISDELLTKIENIKYERLEKRYIEGKSDV